MTHFLLHRLVQSFIVLIGTSVLVFVLLRVVPSDPVALMSPAGTPIEVMEQQREILGLNQPLIVQYLVFVTNAARGEFGMSFRANRPALDLVLTALPYTVMLATVALLVAVAIGLPLGVIAAIRRGTRIDRALMLVGIVGQSVPNFWLGIVLIMAFAVGLHWLPTSGSGGVQHLVLPSLTLASYNISLVARLTRSSMLDVLGQDYVRTARAKGLARRIVIVRHAVRNALIPIVTVIGLQFGTLLGGAVIVEAVFAWPGIGLLVVNAIQWRDYPIVQATVLFSSIIFIVVNLVLDVVYVWIDPRVRY
jgi:ABC-type dipeptide/oligopeptide/nickel transport system permease component